MPSSWQFIRKKSFKKSVSVRVPMYDRLPQRTTAGKPSSYCASTSPSMTSSSSRQMRLSYRFPFQQSPSMQSGRRVSIDRTRSGAICCNSPGGRFPGKLNSLVLAPDRGPKMKEASLALNFLINASPIIGKPGAMTNLYPLRSESGFTKSTLTPSERNAW